MPLFKMPKKKLTKKDTKGIVDLMTKSKDVKLIETKAINDSSFLLEVFPALITIEAYQELTKALVPIMRKHKIVRLQASCFKKWKDGEETMNGTANKV